MTKISKILLGTITLVIILPIVLILTLITIVNPNNYKATITRLVSSNINREVTIDGTLDWSLFPFGISAQKLKVENDPKFKSINPYMIEAEDSTISLELLPLLSKKYNLHTLVLNNTTINLAIDKNGNSNWQSFTESSARRTTNNITISKNQPNNIKKKPEPEYRIYSYQTTTTSTASTASSATPIEFSINKLKITNGTVNFQKDNEKILFNKVNINGKDINFAASPFDLNGTFNVKMKDYDVIATNKFNSTVTISNKLNTYQADIKKLNINYGNNANPNLYKLSIISNVLIDMNKETAKLNPLSVILGGNEITGEATISNLLGIPTYNGKLGSDNIHAGKLEKLGKYLSGKTIFNFKYNTKGTSLDQMISHLNGNLNIKLTNGNLKGIDLDRLLKLLSTKITINPKDILQTLDSTLLFVNEIFDTVTSKEQSTQILSITATGMFKNGVLSNNDLEVTSNKALLIGAGILNLPKQSIDYKLHVYDRLNQENLDLPISVFGNLYDPNYKVDMPTGKLIKNNMKAITDGIKKIPGLENLPVEKLEKLLQF